MRRINSVNQYNQRQSLVLFKIIMMVSGYIGTLNVSSTSDTFERGCRRTELIVNLINSVHLRYFTIITFTDTVTTTNCLELFWIMIVREIFSGALETNINSWLIISGI